MDILTNFSETLSELMLINNLKIKDIAVQIDLDATSFTKYFRNGVIPKLPHAIAIADYFECSLDYLFGLSNERKKSKYLPCPPFSQAFNSILKLNNFTKYRLAKELKVSQKSATDWGTGRAIPTMENLIKIAKHLGCTLDELVGRKTID